MKTILLALAILWPTTPRHSLRIPISCLTKDVILTGCDLGINPPGCKHAVVSYKTKCAIIEAGGSQ